MKVLNLAVLNIIREPVPGFEEGHFGSRIALSGGDFNS